MVSLGRSVLTAPKRQMLCRQRYARLSFWIF